MIGKKIDYFHTVFLNACHLVEFRKHNFWAQSAEAALQFGGSAVDTSVLLDGSRTTSL